jgi:predicted SprT family Zn-dependent metalloprotease
MLITKAERLTLSLIEFHGHTDWRVKFNNEKRNFGCTKYSTKTLEFSIPLIRANDEHVLIDTVLHEIAHIRAGSKAGHGPDWRAVALELGANPDWKKEPTKPAEGRYQAICPCGKILHIHRRPTRRGHMHKGCGVPLTFIDMRTMEELT